MCTAFDPILGTGGTYVLYPPTSPLVVSKFPLAPGFQTVCVITNLGPNPPPIVTITKATNPGTGPWSFIFDIVETGEPADSLFVTLSNSQPTATVQLLPNREYTVTERAAPGYVQSGVLCGPEGGDNVFTTTSEGPFSIGCRATNTQLATATVTKAVLPGTATGWSFNLTISPVPEGETATKPATSAAPSATWTGLVPGSAYTITEATAPGFVPISIDCGAGSPTFTPSPGAAVSCLAVNRQLASLSVTKSVTDAVAGEAWAFDFTIAPVPAGETATKSAASAAATVSWAGLVPGTAYTITEAAPANPRFAAGTLTCGAASAPGTTWGERHTDPRPGDRMHGHQPAAAG